MLHHILASSNVMAYITFSFLMKQSAVSFLLSLSVTFSALFPKCCDKNNSFVLWSTKLSCSACRDSAAKQSGWFSVKVTNL